MSKGKHGFLFPKIDSEKCVSCMLCAEKCPATKESPKESSMRDIYAAWNKEKKTRQSSSSGGIFSLLAETVINDGGLVAGVRWDEGFCPEHILTDSLEELRKLRGSKYVQCNTKNIYSDIKTALISGKKVLFSGTPCHVSALKSFLGKEYPHLFTVDLVCHGVPSYECFERYLGETSSDKRIQNVRLRYKSPYWDYSSVRIDFTDGSHYQKYTVADPYFTLFNIGYSLRESCHNCKFASSNREGDITLADFWGYTPKNAKMRNFNRGISLVATNTEKGRELFGKIMPRITCESHTYERALKTNKTLSEPFTLPDDDLKSFWADYENGMTVEELCKKHVKNPFRLPGLLFLRRLKQKYIWVLKRK